ncbi:MAG: hypothetical protein HY784_01575 [Chloroflexi bacterium]|nr:hypothetical protein [Chloroflexota bacterium]
MRTIAEPVTYEQKLISIIRRLPPERVSEVIDFAHFLEFQTTSTYESVPDGDRSQEEILTENARWDALLATDESQHMLEKMADEVLAEIQAGHARPFVFIEDEEIAPV